MALLAESMAIIIVSFEFSKLSINQNEGSMEWWYLRVFMWFCAWEVFLLCLTRVFDDFVQFWVRMPVCLCICTRVWVRKRLLKHRNCGFVMATTRNCLCSQTFLFFLFVITPVWCHPLEQWKRSLKWYWIL